MRNLYVVLFVFFFLLTANDAEARRHHRRKEKEANPDIKCKLDAHQSDGRQLIEVRLAKLVRNKNGKVVTKTLSAEDGDKLCNSISQILWKKLVEGKAEKDCNEPLKIYVRGKNHKICLDESGQANLDAALSEVEKLVTKD